MDIINHHCIYWPTTCPGSPRFRRGVFRFTSNKAENQQQI